MLSIAPRGATLPPVGNLPAGHTPLRNAFGVANKCDVIISMGKANMEESPVVPMDMHDQNLDAKVFRTSSQARMNSSESPLLQELDDRISNLTRVPVSHNEQVQVLRYRLGEFYAAHNDNFDPAFYQTMTGQPCKEYGERSCEDGEKLILMEANDNHEEEHTVAEFIEFCVHGRTDKSGEWTSKGVGKYLEGGKDAGGQLVDQRFCPRIVEGELRYNLIGDSLIGVIHKKPKEGGISAVGGTGSIYTFYGPDEPLFASLTENFLKKDLPHVMPSLDLAEEPLPLWWTTDFINASPPGTKAEDEKLGLQRLNFQTFL
eukprot:Skav203499  [mRNA]  locus=scaffold2089:96924:112757:- [translate_table: standard]